MHRNTSLLFALCCSIVLLPLTSHAQSNQKIYVNGLYNGWQNSSSCSVSFNSKDYIHSGDTQSIAFAYSSASQSFYLTHAAFSTSPYANLTFWINGGKASGQQISVVGFANTVAQPPVSLNSYCSNGSIAAGTWSQVTIPLSALGVANTNMTGFQLKNAAGKAQPTVYVDDIYLTVATAAPQPAALTILGVATNNDSVKVRYKPVPGAADYRIYDANNPTTVKYAGVWHIYTPPWSNFHFATNSSGNPLIPDQLVANTATVSTPTEMDEPALEIEMNGLTPNKTYNLVVEAVNALGPCPPGTLYDSLNNLLFTTCPCGKNLCKIGSNMGCTADGKTSINGQGNYNNNPQAIASATTTVTPTGALALPSSAAASQVLFDTFNEGGTITPTGAVDPVNGQEFFTMSTPAVPSWEIRCENIDVRDSSVFLMDNHFMDVLFDGGTPGTNNPYHVGHGIISLSPTQTVNFSGGQVLHITEEVDAHMGEDNRRWCDIRLTPANDPFFPMAMETAGQINNTDTEFMLQILGSNFTIDEFTGPSIPNDPIANDPANPPIDNRVVGAPGQATYTDDSRLWSALGTQGIQYGRGLDDRSRFDLFVSTTQFALYEDGVLITAHNFPTPLPFSVAKVYYSHYHYHSALETVELQQYAPYEFYWQSPFYPYSDERHWDNMGYEVLPANTNWNTLSSLVQPPVFH